MSTPSFAQVQVRTPDSNTFDLSHDHKFTTKMGQLTPVLLQECVPGDVFNINTETLIRFAPLVAPVMHKIQAFTHYFFVPNRILWANWEDFISPDLSKEVPPAWPHFKSAGTSSFAVGSLADYLGVPTGIPLNVLPPISFIPFAGYQCIFNEYYRDQNLEPEVNYKLANGNNSPGGFTDIRTRAWRHDYFTSALPFAQKGPAVDLPLYGSAEIYRQTDGAVQNPPFSELTWQSATDGQVQALIKDGDGTNNFALYADLGNASSATINDLRVALRLQEFFEKAARGGSRYIEQIRMHWATIVPDYRLNRPEFIGGTQNPVIISEVLQTSESAETPQATMAGHAISATSGKKLRYRCQEHGYIIGIQSVMPMTAYQQGLPRHFSRQSWEDYAWPTFAHLGEQEIKNKELYIPAVDDLKNEETFGYIPRYSEYRYTPSHVSGEFKSTMAFWHLGRIFTNRPLLNSTFIKCNPRTDIFAVTDPNNQNLWCHAHNKVFVRRKLPKYGTPTL